MNVRRFAPSLGLAVGLTTGGAWAEAPPPAVPPEFTTIDIAGHPVPVVKGGLYDRYRSNPPLSVIAAESPDLDLSWFRQLEKQRVDIGFESYSPNFYYRNSRITAIFTADLAVLKSLLPEQVLAQVQPLQVWPGRGLVALTAYRYRYCDNDSYNEIGLSVVTSPPGSSSWGPLTLLRQSMAQDFWGYVLKLPVNTELARVRGVVGYHLPKWLTEIDYQDAGGSVVVDIFDSETHQRDLTIEGRKLPDLSGKESLVRNSFTNVDAQGRLTTGYTLARQTSSASSSSTDAVTLTLGEGSLSAFIRTLKLGKLLKYEYVPEFQGALYAPRLLEGESR